MSMLRTADPLSGFGQHPRFAFARERYIREQKKLGREAYVEAHFGKPISLKELRNPLHPSVTLIPRDKFLGVLDSFGSPIGFEQRSMYFSSHDIYVDIEDDHWVFETLFRGPMWRTGDIPELGYLTPYDPGFSSWLDPTYSHTRLDHLLTGAAIGDVLLALNGFSLKERAPIVLTIGSHDIAMPIGGDGIKTIDPKFLSEESNYVWFLRHYKLDRLWKKRFGFDLDQAASWVKNHGVIGRFLDVVDKLSYVMLDCYHIGHLRDGQVRQFCMKHPLFMDVWKDVVFSDNHRQFGFTNPDRLYDFLFVRGLEHAELLHNPKSRLIDLCVANLVRPLYQKGLITREQLLTMRKDEFYNLLFENRKKGTLNPSPLVDLDSLHFKQFATSKEANAFANTLDNVFYREYKKGFDPCLDWPIAGDSHCTATAPLRQFLSQDKKDALQSLVDQIRGYYVYWRTPSSQ